MALPSSGAISMNQMHIEVGGSSGTTVGLNDSDIRALISKSAGATMSFNEWYGASATDNTFNGVKSSATVTSGKISTTYHGVGGSTGGALTNGGINPPSGASITALQMAIGAAGENQELVLVLGSAVSSASSFSSYTGYRYVKVGSAIYFDSNVATSSHLANTTTITYSLTFNNGANSGITKFNSISNGTSLSFTLSN